MRIAFLLLGVLLTGTGCAPAAQQSDANGTATAAASTEPAAVRLAATAAGAAVTLTLTNGSSEAIGYNLCRSTLERRDGTTWRAVPTDEVCTAELRTMQPGGSATISKELPANIGEGELRYRTRVETPLGSGMQDIASNAFAAPRR